MNLHHVAIATPDPERLSEFYEQVLELHRLKEWREDQRLRSIWLALGSAILMLERSDAGIQSAPTAFTSKRPGLHLLAFTIDPGERESWRKKLGPRLVHETEFSLYLQDPEGNRIALSHFDVVAQRI